MSVRGTTIRLAPVSIPMPQRPCKDSPLTPRSPDGAPAKSGSGPASTAKTTRDGATLDSASLQPGYGGRLREIVAQPRARGNHPARSMAENRAEAVKGESRFRPGEPRSPDGALAKSGNTPASTAKTTRYGTTLGFRSPPFRRRWALTRNTCAAARTWGPSGQHSDQSDTRTPASRAPLANLGGGSVCGAQPKRMDYDCSV